MDSPPAFRPSTADEIPDFLRDLCRQGKKLRIRGGGSKAAFGIPAEPDQAILDLSAVAGITLYEPDELVLTARAGTRLSDIADAVAERGQCLAFEPPHFDDLLGSGGGNGPTLGGTVACGWSGPRRIKAGAVRDHVLGILAVGGDGENFRSGGRVVKNVTGFDLPKLLTGSHGTLAAMTDITIKVLPAPEATRTLAVLGLDDNTAISLLLAALAAPYEVSGAAHLPVPVAARSSVAAIAGSGGAVTLIRLEGFGPSVADRFATLEDQVSRDHPHLSLDEDACAAIWREVREVAPLIDPQAVVWRLSLRATDAVRVAGEILTQAGGEAFYDWGGGLLWLALPARDAADGHAASVRAALSSGHATLMRAPAEVRATAAVFQPRAAALAALEARVKAAFDPHGILAPHFMTQGS